MNTHTYTHAHTYIYKYTQLHTHIYILNMCISPNNHNIHSNNILGLLRSYVRSNESINQQQTINNST